VTGPGSWFPAIQIQRRPAIIRASQSAALSSSAAASASSKLSPRQITVRGRHAAMSASSRASVSSTS
jgi:hypothetical protein